MFNSSSTICELGAYIYMYTYIHQATTKHIPMNTKHVPMNTDVASLRRLSEDLSSIFESELFSDAKVVVAGGGRGIPVHRCILSSRSDFFRQRFGGGGDRVEATELGYDAASAIIRYLYSGRVSSAAPPEGVSVCVDEDCSHSACPPAVDYAAETLRASFVFQVPELVDHFQRRLFDVVDEIAADDILAVIYAANSCGGVCRTLLEKCVNVVAQSDVDVVALEKALPGDVVELISNSRAHLGLDGHLTNHDKHVKRIHRALESDDVELVRMLLKEGHTNLDDAYALHHAVTYCDAKTTMKVLDLGLADVNVRDGRGRTVLHEAARRREPKVVVSLLTKGARPSDLAPDGRKALQITKRVTRASEYHEEGEGKARLCIEILEQAERRDPLLGEASVSLAMAGDDLRMKLLYLENRVGLAKLLFPMEAKVIMDITKLDGTCEFLGGTTLKTIGTKRTSVDLNEAPFKIQEEHLFRLKSLSRAVELGKRFFPRCSEVLNKIMDADDLSQLAYLGQDTPSERLVKKQRYVELQEVLSKAFDEDKEEIGRSAISPSSSSSTSLGAASQNFKLNLNKK